MHLALFTAIFIILQTRTLNSECHTAFWLPSIKPSKTSARIFREDRGVSKSIKRHLNSILNEDILSDSDSEEPIEES